MNANYGVLEPLPSPVRDKALKKRMFAERSLARIGRSRQNSAGADHLKEPNRRNNIMPEFRGTTICAVKRGGKTAIGR